MLLFYTSDAKIAPIAKTIPECKVSWNCFKKHLPKCEVTSSVMTCVVSSSIVLEESFTSGEL